MQRRAVRRGREVGRFAWLLTAADRRRLTVFIPGLVEPLLGVDHRLELSARDPAGLDDVLRPSPAREAVRGEDGEGAGEGARHHLNVVPVGGIRGGYSGEGSCLHDVCGVSHPLLDLLGDILRVHLSVVLPSAGELREEQNPRARENGCGGRGRIGGMAGRSEAAQQLFGHFGEKGGGEEREAKGVGEGSSTDIASSWEDPRV